MTLANFAFRAESDPNLEFTMYRIIQYYCNYSLLRSFGPKFMLPTTARPVKHRPGDIQTK